MLATDGSPDARLAARAAAGLARVSSTHLEVVHACSLPAMLYPDAMVAGAIDYLRSIYEHLLAREVAALERAGAPRVQGHMAVGRPSDVVLDAAADLRPSLLVAGSRGLSGLRRAMVGSVSESLVHNAECPVMVLRAGRRGWPPSQVIVGDDASVEARRAVEFGAALAVLLGCPLTLLGAISPRLGDTRSPGGVRRALDAQNWMRGLLKTRADKVRRATGVNPRLLTPVADAADALIAESRAAEGWALIVVGRRGVGRIARMRLGSTSSKVLRGATGPVLVVPAKGEGGRM
jgi:nucleotide-binding universal stress UspA family protein